MKDCITTYTKIEFDTMNPVAANVAIEDIAHALSMISRANGHFPEFFSVAQHCIQCCEEALERNYSPRVAMACLLHDASEAYLSDVTRPVKKNMTMYLQIEEQVQNIVYEKYLGSLPTEKEEKLIHNIDDGCLYYEFKFFMGECLFPIEPVLISTPEYETRPFKEVEKEFLILFDKLRKILESEKTE